MLINNHITFHIIIYLCDMNFTKLKQVVVIYSNNKPYKAIYIDTIWFLDRFKESSLFEQYIVCNKESIVEKYLKEKNQYTKEITHICNSINHYIYEKAKKRS